MKPISITSLLFLSLSLYQAQIVIPGIGTIGRPPSSPTPSPPAAPPVGDPVSPAPSPSRSQPATGPPAPSNNNPPQQQPTQNVPPTAATSAPSNNNPSRTTPPSGPSPSSVVIAANANNRDNSGVFTNPARISPSPSSSTNAANADNSKSSSSAAPAWRTPVIIIGCIVGLILILGMGAYVYNNFIKPDEADDVLGTMPFRKPTTTQPASDLDGKKPVGGSPGFATYPTTGRSNNGIGFVQHSGNNSSSGNGMVPNGSSAALGYMNASSSAMHMQQQMQPLPPQIQPLDFATTGGAATGYMYESHQQGLPVSSAAATGEAHYSYAADPNYNSHHFVDSNGYQYAEQDIYGYYDAQGNYYQHHPQQQS